MRVLWIVNTIFPKVTKELGLAAPISGGWMYGLAEELVATGQISLAVATFYSGRRLNLIEIDGVSFYLIPACRLGGSRSYRRAWAAMLDSFRPDFVHIHGTEYRMGADFLSFFPDKTYIVSIQGLISAVGKHYLDGLETSRLLKSITFRDLVRLDPLFMTPRVFRKHVEVERDYIRRAKAVLGRTEWDYAHVRAVDESVEYLHLNESLRPEFYCGSKWELPKCKRNSIFISQASYPVKGLHQLLMALSLLRNRFPNMTLMVGGPDILAVSSVRDRLRRSGYSKYIQGLVRDLHLDGVVKFLGPLDAIAMRSQYLQSHVFVCPSSVENSPNSLGEAQILGVPCVASYVGGIPSMVKDGVGALLYPFDEPEVLANKLATVFMDDELATSLSYGGQQEAAIRHNRESNLNRLLTIYRSVVPRFAF